MKLKYTILLIALAMFLAVASAAEQQPTFWTRWFPSFFNKGTRAKMNKIALTPATLGTITTMEVNVENGKDLLHVDGSDKVHILFPQWWITNQAASPLECTLHVDSAGVKKTSVTWTPINPADTSQGPILTLAPTEDWYLKPDEKFSVLCTGIATPATAPTKEELEKLRKAHESKATTAAADHHLVSHDFGLVFINDGSMNSAIDTILTLDEPLAVRPSTTPFLVTISGSDGEVIKTDKKGLIPDKYHKAMCAYIKKLAKVKTCKYNDAGLSPSGAPNVVYTVTNPKIYSIDDINNKMGENRGKIEGFKKFAKDLYKLRSTPNITIVSS